MLSETDASIAEIALACGFSSQSHLTSAFSKRVGAAPGVYRRTVRG
ncbi:MAG: helix-turn-helix domain-containing protein [Pseudomonadota bacterium]